LASVAIGADVVEQSLFKDLVVMAVVQCASTGKEVDIAGPRTPVDPRAFGRDEDFGESADVAANVGFVLLKDVHGSVPLVRVGAACPKEDLEARREGIW
jgi:hypothetical protein